jgi:hypothetical protein
MGKGKKITKVVLLLLAGFVAGALTAGPLTVLYYAGLFRGQYFLGILSNAHTVYMIRSGREDQLVKTIETNLSDGVVGAKRIFGINEESLPAFWAVQRYYKTFDLPVPAELAPILESLPPQPPWPPTACELKRLEEKTATPNMEQASIDVNTVNK